MSDTENTSTAIAIVSFNENAIAEFGKNFLLAVVAHETAREDAEKELSEASKRENFIDFELTRGMLHLHTTEQVDLFKIFGDKKEVQALNRQVLVKLGALKRTTTDNDEVIYEFTDPALEGTFNYDDALKKKDETEYKRRHSRRTALNIRLARCAKAAVAMADSGATMADLSYVTDEKTGERQAQITKGPKEIVGTVGKAVIHSKNAAKVEGASAVPSIGGLAKVAESAHMEKTSKATAETTTSKAGEGGNTETDFLSLMNAAIMAIKGKEGKFSDVEMTAVKNLLTTAKESGIK